MGCEKLNAVGQKCQLIGQVEDTEFQNCIILTNFKKSGHDKKTYKCIIIHIYENNKIFFIFYVTNTLLFCSFFYLFIFYL